MTPPGHVPRSIPAPPAEQRRDARCQAWYGAYGPAVYRYFRFHVDSADTAEDLTADTFLRVLEAGDRYDPARSEARVWVFTIARNALRDHFRRTRVRKHVTLATLRDLAVEAPSPEERLLRQEEFDLLLSGVRQLRPGDRELISLRYGSELEFAKIAEVLGMREASVRTRLWRALTRLRELVGEKE